jgi:hypothetical protein
MKDFFEYRELTEAITVRKIKKKGVKVTKKARSFSQLEVITYEDGWNEIYHNPGVWDDDDSDEEIAEILRDEFDDIFKSSNRIGPIVDTLAPTMKGFMLYQGHTKDGIRTPMMYGQQYVYFFLNMDDSKSLHKGNKPVAHHAIAYSAIPVKRKDLQDPELIKALEECDW